MTSRPTLTTPIQVRFADLDVLGHVNHVQYIAFMETARVRWMSEYGGALRGGVLVARTECDHRREIPGHTDTVDVTVSVESVGRSSFVVLHVLRVGDEEVAVGRTVLVAVGADRRPRPVSDEERARLLGE
jgi:acyl-CoA thioester hydrolase